MKGYFEDQFTTASKAAHESNTHGYQQGFVL
jgi:hypothetical protein